MIDLHLHTIASDGMLSSTALVTEAARAGITVLSVTDHDTIGGLDEACAAAATSGLRLVTGIEITAVEDGRDVHILGYFFDPSRAALRTFLADQRADRRRRIAEIARRLRELGLGVDEGAILQAAAGPRGRSVGRPQLADALVRAGYVSNRREAFDRWLGEGCPAFVPRRGARPAAVVDVVHEADGLASLAHPGLLQMDGLIAGLAAHGLDAIEARHSDHDPATEQHYRDLAADFGLAVSGGSDFHGEDGRLRELGEISLPDADFALLEARCRT